MSERRGRASEAQRGIGLLQRAIAEANSKHPLPRCRHGHALRDMAGDELAPSCGCTDAKDREPRTKYMDPDYRRDPKTTLWCARCQKDITGEHRFVFVINDCDVLHPDDAHMADRYPDAYGWQPIGMNCARWLGLAWTLTASVRAALKEKANAP